MPTSRREERPPGRTGRWAHLSASAFESRASVIPRPLVQGPGGGHARGPSHLWARSLGLESVNDLPKLPNKPLSVLLPHSQGSRPDSCACGELQAPHALGAAGAWGRRGRYFASVLDRREWRPGGAQGSPAGFLPSRGGCSHGPWRNPVIWVSHSFIHSFKPSSSGRPPAAALPPDCLPLGGSSPAPATACGPGAPHAPRGPPGAFGVWAWEPGSGSCRSGHTGFHALWSFLGLKFGTKDVRGVELRTRLLRPW